MKSWQMRTPNIALGSIVLVLVRSESSVAVAVVTRRCLLLMRVISVEKVFSGIRNSESVK